VGSSSLFKNQIQQGKVVKPLQHAKISAKKHGGKWQDYIKIHQWFDQTKAHIADMRHRAILHNAFGIQLCSQVFGEVMVNSSGKEISVRDIGEDHVLEDLGTIPSINKVIESIDFTNLSWLGGVGKRKGKIISLKEDDMDEETTPNENNEELYVDVALDPLTHD
jgi:RNA-binding protein YlmH